MKYKDVKRIIEQVFDIDDISKKTRERHYVKARMVYYAMCRKYVYAFTLSECGRSINMHHASVIYTLNKCDWFLFAPGEREFKRDYDEAEKFVREVRDHRRKISNVLKPEKRSLKVNRSLSNRVAI